MVKEWVPPQTHRKRQRSGFPRLVRRSSFQPLLLLVVASVFLCQIRGSSGAGDDAIEVSWDFDRSADDWAKASSVEMDAEVQWRPSGTIRGTVRGPSPHLDSPPFLLPVNDRHHVVVRMKSSGPATLGRLELRTGHVPGQTDHGLNPWTTRRNASVIVEYSSSGGDRVTHAADGDLATVWEADGNSNEWITLDLRDSREVAAVRIQAPGGDGNPRNVRFQRGGSAGGKFATVANFILGNSSDAQEFTVPTTRGRYWRVYVLDGYGGDRTSLREVALLGPSDTALPEALEFGIENDDAFHVYYVPIYKSFQGVLTQLRLSPGVKAAESVGRWSTSLSPKRGDAFEIDWIRIARAPHVKLVRGCIDSAYAWPEITETGQGFAVSNVTARNVLINGVLELGRTRFGTLEGAEYGKTKACLREGGETLTIVGAAFGANNARVFVDGSPCAEVRHTPGREKTELTCLLPPITATTTAAIAAAAEGSASVAASRDNNTTTTATTTMEGVHQEVMSTVEVVNGNMPGLSQGVKYMSYQAPPPSIGKPSLSNVAAISIDVSWEPPTDYWHALAVTGYQIGWRTIQGGLNEYSNLKAGYGSELGEEDMIDHWMTVGNVTVTTARGLVPGTPYAFWVRGLSENRSDPAGEQVDAYGRRKALDGAVAGIRSEASDVVATLDDDILFKMFNANLTLNHSATSAAAVMGPRGQWAGEGHYGLQLVGTAQIENCNRSASCCDGYDETSGTCGIGIEGSPYSCAALATPGETWALDTEASSVGPPLSGDTSSSPSSPVYTAAGRLPSSAVVVPRELALLEGWGSGVSRGCGPALRLTASRAASAGAAWYPRQETVGEGFDTTFTFRMSSPSLRCNTMDGVYTSCRSRGADGLAFVVQGEGSTALGKGGVGLGYAGISNSLAVEFDTHYNPEMQELYENHVSVQTRGWRHPISAHDSYALGSTTNVPDLTDGEITARVVYTPIVTPEDVFHPAFQALSYFGHFLTNGDFQQGGLADWGVGIGILSVFVGSLHEPCLMVPLNLEATLRLHHSRAFVGFTAATGRNTWQVHDMLRWSFSSLRQDTPHWPAMVINGNISNDQTANNNVTNSSSYILGGEYNTSCVGDASCVAP